MKTIFFALISALVVMSSCSIQRKADCPPASIVIKDSILTETKTLYRDTIIEVPGENVFIDDTLYLPCPDQVFNYKREVKSGRASVSVRIANGKISVDCRADSLQLVIDSLATVISNTKATRTTTITVEKPVTVVKYRVPKWCWYLLLINAAYLVYRFRSPISSLITQILRK